MEDNLLSEVESCPAIAAATWRTTGGGVADRQPANPKQRDFRGYVENHWH